MTDIDFCSGILPTGEECKMRKICKRYDFYLHKKIKWHIFKICYDS